MKFIRAVCLISASCVSLSCLAAEKSLSERYPNRLITSDYGIVTADDLAYDATQRDAVPYDPNKEWLTRYWQCLPLDGISPKYRTWREAHSNYSVRPLRLCDLEIHVNQSSGMQVYGDRRAYPNEYCRNFDRRWKQLTKGETIVCFDGDWGNYDYDEVRGRYKAWTWNKIKTRKGCYSYFGDCNVQGCAQGKCAN